MRWIIDAQLPPALAEFLRARGHEASHVQDVGLRDKTDNEIWNHALSSGANSLLWSEQSRKKSSKLISYPVRILHSRGRFKFDLDI